MKKCLVLLENNQPNLPLELLEVSHRIFEKSSVFTVGLPLDSQIASSAEYFDVLVHAEGSQIPAYDTANIALIAAKLHEEYGFDCIIVPATNYGRMVAPRLAMRLDVGLVADVTGLEQVNGQLEMIRPAYSGKLFAGIVKKGMGPLMMTIRPGVFPAATNPFKTTQHRVFPFQRKSSGITFIGSREKPATKDIRDSEVLISGGGGVLEHFSRLQDLSEALRGQVSASRRIVDSGVASRKIQVGQSGKTVSPRLYIALGIYGSVQHMEGLKNVQHLISVNIDPLAPICSLADVVVVGDAVDFIDQLLKRIQR